MKVCFLCSGLGSRMEPLTSKYHKSMVPVPYVYASSAKVHNIKNSIDVIKDTFGSEISSVNVVGSHDYFNRYHGILKLLSVNEIINDYDSHEYNNQMSVKLFLEQCWSDSEKEDIMIVEGDVYLTHGFTRLTVDESKSNYYCEYRSNEWVFFKRQSLNYYGIAKGFNGLAMAGVSIIRSHDIPKLVRELENSDKSEFWDEALIRSKLDLNLVNAQGSIMEYDTIQDLVSSKLLTEKEVASLLSDDQNVVPAASLTNHAYIISYNGRKRVIRFSGKGTDQFIHRERERVCTALAADLTPKTEFYGVKNDLKISDYIDGSRTMTSSSKDISQAVSLVASYHNLLGGSRGLLVDLIEEIRDYEEIYKKSKTINFPKDFRKMSKVFNDFIVNHQHEELVLCHRDMDPGNILIKDDDRAYLLDFEYSGLLNRYWDWGALISEQELYFRNGCCDEVCDYVSKFEKIDKDLVIKWSAVVDYVWSVWTLAKIALGENYTDYLNERWNRACSIAKSQNMI